MIAGRSAPILWLALFPAVAAAQIGSVGYTTEGAIVGRVCEDLDGDGACSADEPGLSGAKVVLELGLTAITDSAGRFHFAALEARRPEPLVTVRLAPGRHRVKVDARELFPGATVTPDGATVELSMGALATIDFAVRRPPATAVGTRPADLPPRGELQAAGVRLQLTGQVAPGSTVKVEGAAAEVTPEGTWSVWRELPPGATDVPIVVRGPDGRVSLFTQRVEVVRRASGVLIIPRAPQPLGVISIPPAIGSGAVVSVEAAAGTKVTVEGRAMLVGPSGRASAQLRSATPGAIPLRWEVPGQPVLEATIGVETSSAPMLVGLLDLELALDVDPKRVGLGPRLFGRGAGSARATLFGLVDLAAEVDLRDSDVEGIRGSQGQGALALATARSTDTFERSVDWLRTPLTFGDDSATIASNPSGGRIRVELSREGVGSAGYGTTRAWLGNAEVGRYHRALFGGFVDLRTPDGKLAQVRARGFAAPTEGDPTSGLARRPAHERFESTGGSLFYLSNFAIVQGSELVRVELNDGITGLPIEELHLLRGRDYTIDYLSGRILLTQPLSLMGSAALLGFEAPTGGSAPVLVVDYEHTELAGSRGAVVGGELSGKIGPVTLGGGAVSERGAGYSLLHARVFAPIGPVSLSAEVARSEGMAEGLAFSDDGGLTAFKRPSPLTPVNGWALTVRARGSGLFGRGFFDVSYRRRSDGFSDSAHYDTVLFQQISARVSQPLGPVIVTGLFDDRTGVDPRAPFGTAAAHARTVGGGLGWDVERWGVRLEARDSELGVIEGTGGRTSLGLSGRVKITEWLTVVAGHKQRILERGSGPGRWDDSFSSAGVELHPDEDLRLGVRGGYGVVLGPQVWGHASWKNGDVTHYAGHAFDADAPSLGESRTVAGARQQVGPAAAIFVEDVAAHDVNSLRLSRAVGLTQELAPGFSVSARYEHGLRRVLDDAPVISRNAGGVTASLVRQSARIFGRGEVRSDGAQVQWVAAGGGEVRLFDVLSAAARFQFAHTRQGPQMIARLLEGTVSVAWRPAWGAVVARYTLQRELAPPSQGGFAQRSLDLVSLMPTVRMGSRFTLGAGAHVALSGFEGARTLLLSASLRPAVRIIGGLEVAAEVARRSQAQDGQLTAVRGEVGWRFNENFLLAAGFTALGFNGLGLNETTPDARNRAYLRAEAAF